METNNLGIFERIPELNLRMRAEEYERLRKILIDILRGREFAKDFFTVHAEDQEGIVTREIETPDGAYTFIRNLESNFADIQIQKSGYRVDNPNFLLEEVRFKVGRPEKTDAVPDLEYHRSLRKGGSRTLRNNFAALKRIDRFVSTLSAQIIAKK